MGRLRLVGASLLTVLTLLPAAGTLCVALCHPAAVTSAADHHGVQLAADPNVSEHHHHHDVRLKPDATNEPDATRGFNPHVSSPSHDCRTHDTTLQASIVTERAHPHADLVALGPIANTSRVSADDESSFTSLAALPPLIPASAAASPLVLRI